jgi:glycosyltransferase involved in cell wall biosynthesis
MKASRHGFAAGESGSQHEVTPMTDQRPVLSAIVISRDNESTIEEALRSVVDQKVSSSFEVIVVVSGSDRTAEIVKRKFPQVTLVELETPALPGRARNAGLRLARGKYISFPGSHVRLVPGSLEARIRAHDHGYTMVTGSILNGTDTRAGWASYFMDHSDALPGRPSLELDSAPHHCSYERHALLACGPFPEDVRAGEDTVMNTRIWNRGGTAYRDNTIQLYHRNRCSTPWRLVRHHFMRGRAWGRILRERGEVFGATRNYVSRRYRMTERNVQQWGGDLIENYRRSRPLVRLGIWSAFVGICYERWISR